MAMGQSKIIIPTGYESEQRNIERRRKIAEALMSRGMQSQQMTSPWQAIGSVANVLASRLLEKKADKASDSLNERIQSGYADKMLEFNNDARTMKPEDVVMKWRADPMMADAVKPYEAALQRALTEREGLTTFSGKMQRQGDVIGQYEEGKATDLVNRDAQGNFRPNAVAIDAASRVASANQGYTPVDQPAPAPTAQPTASSGNIMPFEAVKGLLNSLGPNGALTFLQRNKPKIKVSTPEEARQLPSGTIIVLPDGSEGRVP